MDFSKQKQCTRTALIVFFLPITGCYHYRPQPLLPPALEQQYRSRSLMDPGLREFVEAQPVDAGKIDEIKAEAKKAYDDQLRSMEEKYKPVIAERDSLKTSLHDEIVGGSFSRSKFIADKLAIPADIAQARFGSAFAVEDGKKLVAKDSKGNVLFSRARPGEVAEFDEALELLVDAYPYKDNILKGSGASGGGAGGSGGGAGGKKTMTRSAFDALDPSAQAAAVKDTAIVD